MTLTRGFKHVVERHYDCKVDKLLGNVNFQHVKLMDEPKRLTGLLDTRNRNPKLDNVRTKL